ncbi:MAG: thioredoxin family protein [Campylobacterota bacterium]|nr:thioredoxin family protein [Campylobacterota bacterium]
MNTIETIQSTLKNEPAVMIYFSAPTCNVCHALKPKLLKALHSNFESFEVISIDIVQTPEIAAHFSVFAIPTVLIFLDNQEFLRKSRHMSVDEVIAQIQRPYTIMFS